MGVPTFYRWLCSRFPKVPKDITNKANTSGEGDSHFTDSLFTERYDNLYLDMNGIVHPCCHPEYLPQPSNEEEMFEAIFDYIDRLIETIRPKRLLYLALDGVAPRAKMNQQRSRRFKAVYEREYAQKQLQNDKSTPETNLSKSRQNIPQNEQQKVWDSNVITPGTPFMYQLGLEVEEYVSNRLENSDIWHNLTVIISDSNSPGEGEHKIINFIRTQRQSSNYDPNTRHVIHGMDADLIMLALATHEPNFFILREVVPFKQFNSTTQPTISDTSETVPSLKYSLMLRKSWKQLQIIQIPVLREYLSYLFKDCGCDLERCIDDLVLMCFFCGNDFLPHLPSMSITLGSIDQMIYLYQQIFPTLGGYLTDCGKINMPQLEMFTSYLTAVEHETLSLKGNNHGATRRAGNADNVTNNDEEETSKTGIDVTLGSPEVYKKSYYIKKLDCSEDDVAKTASAMAGEYVKGMEWVLEYYYQGIPSWNWYYPYHYAPFASDLKFTTQNVFQLGTPFTPLQQLMSVLPVQSSHCLPEKFADLMRSEVSPIAEYYPRTLKLDPNGSRYRYQWVALLPFIDEQLLLATVKPLEEELSKEEKERNKLKSEKIFVHKNMKINRYLDAKIDNLATKIDLPIHIGSASLILTCGSINVYNYKCDKVGRHISKLLKGINPQPRFLELGDIMDESRYKGFNCHVAKRMISHYIHKSLPQDSSHNATYRNDLNYNKRQWHYPPQHIHPRQQYVEHGHRDHHSISQSRDQTISKDELLGGYSLKCPDSKLRDGPSKRYQCEQSGAQFQDRENKRFRR
ncbi:XRN2, RAT1, 5'-3' exoribonuclease 2 [Babesia microti strain RI]|uniref:5'-3' exoribonuclease n=1 Tax=Babesia microti (strain RI) TaxID=1133968 RepID=A0A1N6LWA2_BABMR|nr:XRN2, RAT1, 5'-3' exoribonuclease 2 [Babesia microti strain RI]SIO73155.1 XRN2, RAT1, 5'-3' exoribonuclease 2 [Babesia microti strain RI]|eukprot:XP_021337266.1 XRN2, RAT1, 5'-3' exoribonuclease 2 [Babesia microti strain RI]